MTDTAQIIQTIRALFDIVANSERDSDEVREALAELAKDPSFLLLLRGVAEEIGGGIHIHIHESHHHSHTHVPQREKERQPYNPYVINPTVTWEEKIPIEPLLLPSASAIQWTMLRRGPRKTSSALLKPLLPTISNRRMLWLLPFLVIS